MYTDTTYQDWLATARDGDDARRISTSFALMPGMAPGMKLQASLSIVF